MTLHTNRLFLRPWREDDAETLFFYAKDPAVGPIAGWPPHKSVEESLEIIRTVFSAPETYAIILKKTATPIGCIGLKTGEATDMTDREDECELGFWLGVPYWAQGLMTEAAKEMIRHAFEDCRMKKVWCGYYDGNHRSKRVQEKCGFIYQWTTDNVDVPLMHETRKGHVSCLTAEEWKNNMKEVRVSLIPLQEDDREQFIFDNQRAFKYGAQEEFGMRDERCEEGEEVISRGTIEQSIDGEDAETYRIVLNGKIVGGLVLNIDKDAQKGELELLFVNPEAHSKGIGQAAWKAVERMHPEIHVWETITPYFEKRNIHFYINRCGFHIVEFWNKHFHGPAIPEEEEGNWSEDDEMFLFRKIID
ncbi:MAG: GNAT family N-acetyltransferase [Prevotella sp.]|nr:GNAT family N-acetyltransferase [Prevotella sp.]